MTVECENLVWELVYIEESLSESVCIEDLVLESVCIKDLVLESVCIVDLVLKCNFVDWKLSQGHTFLPQTVYH